MKKKNLLAVEIILGLLLAGCVGWLIYGAIQKKEQEKVYEEMQKQIAQMQQEPETEIEIETESVVVETETETEIEEPKIYCEKTVDFETIKAENADIYAWLTVPGTDVNYPVLQTEEDDYYLTHNLDHSKGRPGAIYSNASCNNKDFTDFNTIFYGHNMRNGTMFGTLHRFDEADFFEENSTILIYTEENRFTYEIVAVRKVSDVYLPSYYNFEFKDSQQAYIDMFLGEITDDISHVREGVTVTTDDKLLTLSTCVYQENTARYLVIGKLVETAEYAEVADTEATADTEVSSETIVTDDTEDVSEN